LRCVWPYFNLVPGLVRDHSSHQMRCVAKPLEPLRHRVGAIAVHRRVDLDIVSRSPISRRSCSRVLTRRAVSDRSGTFARSQSASFLRRRTARVKTFLPRRPDLRRRGHFRRGRSLGRSSMRTRPRHRTGRFSSRGDRSRRRCRYASPPRSGSSLCGLDISQRHNGSRGDLCLLSC
jgi:hypothetical protein